MIASGSVDAEPSLLRGLSEQQQVRLTEILDEYLQQLERGETPSRDEILSAAPEISSQLREALLLYLDKLEELYQLADGGRPLGSNLEGKQLGDYLLAQEIGRGGMGIVCQAEDQALKRQVAVKLLPMAAMLEPKYIDRFRGEAQAAASLEHPNIVPIFSVGEDAGIHYYAMRLIEGDSLDKRIEKHRQRSSKPPTNSALLQFADVADALHEAHEYGIVHRDIKPSNLLLDEEGKLWVADFGLARVQGDHRLTGTGEMVGTMRYMSPEQAMGRAEQVDYRTDIYSLGATLYELLCLQPAIQGEDGPHLLPKITSQSPIHLQKLRPDLPKDLQTVVEKAMARHRDDRYETAAEFAADLRRVAREEPIEARLVTPFELFVRWAANNPRNVAVAVASLAAVGLLFSTGSYMLNQLILSERDRAIRDVEVAHSINDDELIDELAFVPGAEKIRQKIILKQLLYFEDFVERSKDRPRMQPEVARDYMRMGSLAEQLGKMPQAISHFKESESRFARIVSIDSLGAEHWAERFENCNFLALALSQAGRHEEAADILADWVLPLREREKADLPPGILVAYGLAENNFGLVQQKIPDRINESTDAFRIAIRVLGDQLASNSDDLEVARGLSAAQHNLGSLLATDSKRHEEALELLESALVSQTNLASGAKQAIRVSNDLLTTWISLGNLHLKSGDQQLAVEAFDQASQIAGKLVAISPLVDSYRRDLAVSQANLGMALYRQFNYAEAREELSQSVTQYRQLLNLYPEHTGIQSSLGLALNNQGIVQQKLQEMAEAEKSFVEAASLLESSLPLQATALVNVYRNHVRMLREEGRYEEALVIEEKRQLALANQPPSSTSVQ